MKPIYLDNAATTKVAPEVLKAMLPYFGDLFGNAASEYRFSAEVRKAVEISREAIASFLGASPFEIYFTSGGTESDNWALKAVSQAMRGKGNHIITSKIEHHAVLKTCEHLERQGFEVTYLGVDENGLVSPGELKAAIRPSTILISVMYANNEIGSIQRIKEIGEIACRKKILFHTDAVQAYGHIPIDVKACHIDLLSASAHKLGGPKGIGLLYASNKATLAAWIHGGSQEHGLRAGTLNTPGIVGLAKATDLAGKHMAESIKKEMGLRDYLISRILAEIPGSRLNGGKENRLPNNANFSFYKIDGSALLYSLEEQGIFVSSGSACTAKHNDTSHVLKAIGVPSEYINGTVRMTLSRESTREEMAHVADTLKSVIAVLRGGR